MPATDYDVFLSYAHADNSDGWVTRLRDAIVADHRLYSTQELHVFFDTRELASMDDWEHRILGALQSSAVLVVCLSPAYFQSQYCHMEFDEYLRRSAHIAASGEGIATVYFVEVPDLGHPADPSLLSWQRALLARQANMEPWFPNGRNRWAQAEADRRLHEITKGLGDAVAERLRRIRGASRVPGNIRAPSPAFVGRATEARLLHDRVALSAPGTVAVLHGLGGMGKTELAVAYANQYRAEYQAGVWWLSAEGQGNLWSLISRLSDIPGFPFHPIGDTQAADARQLGRIALDQLRSHVHATGGSDRVASLIVLDNVDNPGLLAAAALSELGGEDWLRLLVTTRLGESDFGTDPRLAFVPVGPLEVGDGLALLAHHQRERGLPAGQVGAAQRIVELLDGFTLAVEQVAIHLGLTGQQPADLLTALESGSSADDLMADGSPGAYSMAHREKLLTAVLASTIAALPTLEAALLRWAAHLPPERIPWVWLGALAQSVGLLADPTGERGPRAMDSARRRLEGRRLLLPGEEQTGRMHRLISAELRRGPAGQQAGDTLAAFLRERAGKPAMVATDCEHSEWLAAMLFDLTDANSPLARVTRNSAHHRRPDMDRAEVATTLALEALRQDSPDIAAAMAGTIRSATGVSWVPVATSDRTDPRLRRTLTGHRDWVNDVALGRSASGELILATASHDTTVGLWRVADGTRYAELRGHTNWASTVAFSPPPQPALASGGWDGTIRLWDPADGSPIAAFHAHDGPVFDLAWGSLPDGRRILASSGADSLGRIWDPQSATALTPPLAGHRGGVRAVAWAVFRQRALVATGSLDTTIRLWDAASGRPLGVPLRGHEQGVLGVALATLPGQLLLASASLDGTVRIWDATRGVQMGSPLDAGAGAVRAVTFQGHADGLRVISAHWDGAVRSWDVASGAALGEPMRGHEYAATALSVFTDNSGSWLASAGADDTARMWSLDGQPDAASAAAASGWPTGLTLMPDPDRGCRLLVLMRGASMRHFTGTGQPVAAAPSNPEAACAVYVGWPTPQVVVAGADGGLSYLDARTWQVTVEVSGDDAHGLVRWLVPAQSPDGQSIVVAATSDTISTWNGIGQRLAVQRFPGGEIVALAGGTRVIAVGLGDGQVLTLDTADLAILGQYGDQHPALALALLPDPWEPRIVAGDQAGRLVLRSSDGGIATTLTGGSGDGAILALTSVLLPSRESLLLSAGSDQVVRVWRPDRPADPVRELGGFPDAVTALSALVTPAGNVLVAALSGASWVLAELLITEPVTGIAEVIA